MYRQRRMPGKMIQPCRERSHSGHQIVEGVGQLMCDLFFMTNVGMKELWVFFHTMDE